MARVCDGVRRRAGARPWGTPDKVGVRGVRLWMLQHIYAPALLVPTAM